MKSRLKPSIYILLTIGITIGLMGCSTAERNEQAAPNKRTTTEADAKEAVETSSEQDALIHKFNTVVSTAKEASDIVSFLNENLNKAGQNHADQMVRELYAFYSKDLQTSQEAFFGENVQNVLTEMDWPITSANAASIQDEAVRQLVVTKLSGGYKLVWVEGTIYPIVDYSNQQKYSMYLSKPLNSYIALKAAESSEPAAMDAGLVIAWDELANRAIMAETFLNDYPDSPDYKEVEGIYLDSYLRMYIQGLANTPIFDSGTLKLVPEVKASYVKLSNENPNSVTGIMADRFLEILAKSDDVAMVRGPGGKQMLPEVDQFQKNYRRVAQKLLQEA
ncbi:hypothetical protein SAMN05216378_3198 [Paenibacillus catalpae]|uniref:Uncharacterized protein n=1 Tax=Paenibacillus catalpae TaxID=1045775 RepID=A0A1I2AQ77_9BACL|nr:hypothetical protein [Paenibacillus catalpae]SFE46101.1 hypothetical protein SAMN05216378_3198 [Paenibacillus catalpae]